MEHMPVRRGSWIWDWTKAVVTAFLLFILIRSLIFEAFKIPTGSMERTLMVGDFLLVNKAIYGAEIPLTHTRLPSFSLPDRGDVVVFFPPHDPHRNYVKRLVGMPGDTLEMRKKVLWLNGKPQPEPYIRSIDPLSDPGDSRMMWQLAHLVRGRGDGFEYRPTRDNWGPIVVPPGRFFALGDNRDNSEDSRYWGFLDATSIRGRPMFVYYSFDRGSANPFAWLTSVRWARIGEAIR